MDMHHAASGTLFVDAGVRHFLFDGLARAAPHVMFVLSVRQGRYASSKFRYDPEIPKCSNRVWPSFFSAGMYSLGGVEAFDLESLGGLLG